MATSDAASAKPAANPPARQAAPLEINLADKRKKKSLTRAISKNNG